MTTALAPPTLAGGGRSVSVGSTATLLTEYAPITVINTSTASRVYLQQDSNIAAAQAVPLDPGTSFLWRTPGPLYAVIDVAAPDPAVTLVLTGAGSDWSPSPVAIGAAIAAQLLTSGIPLISRSTQIFSYPVTPPSQGNSGWIDVSAYQSLSLVIGQLSGTGLVALLVCWSETVLADPMMCVKMDEITTGINVANASQSFSMPIRGNFVNVKWLDSQQSFSYTISSTVSTRFTDRLRSHYSNVGGYAILSQGNISLPPATTRTFNVLPVEGPVAYQIGSGAPSSGSGIYFGFNPVTSDFVHQQEIASGYSSTAASHTGQVVSPMLVQNFNLQNTGNTFVNVAWIITRVPV